MTQEELLVLRKHPALAAGALSERLIAEKQGPIGWLTFNNPARRNAISIDMWEAIPKALDRFEQDPEVRVIVLKGEGDKAFVSGADVSQYEKQRSSAEGIQYYEEISGRVSERLQSCDKVIVAMIRGYCLGAGVNIALCCDLRIAAEDARLGIPAAKLGLGYRASHDPSVQAHRPRAAEIERDARRGGVRGAREGMLREPGLHRGPARFNGEEETAFQGKIGPAVPEAGARTGEGETMRGIFAAVIALACAGGALAQGTFPNRPVTMVVGFAPGGGTDITARIIVKKLSEYIGQSIVVENRPGAGGSIAATAVAKAAPDGYTIHLANVGALSVAPHLNSNLPYNPQRDFAPISMAVVLDNVLVVHPSVQAKTLAEYVKEANERPGGMPYGTSGIGGAGHLAGELLKLMAKANLVHVPYKGGGPAMSDILGGQIPSMIATAPTAAPHVKAGKIRALATTGTKRSTFFPDVPPVAEAGYPGFEAVNWYAYVAPAKTPKEIVDRWNREIVKVLNTQETREQLLANGMEPTPSTPEELARYMERELATWGRVVKEAGIQAE